MNIDDAKLISSNKKYSKYHSELHRSLTQMERVPLSDFAALNNGLGQMQRIVASNNTLNEFPDKLLFCRVIGKCLDPHCAAGVHRKAIETLGKIFAQIGKANLARDLPLFTTGVFSLFPHAAIQTRPDLLSLIEQYVLPLPPFALLQSLDGLLAAVLPALEESPTTDLYKRGATLIDSTLANICAGSSNNNRGEVAFYKALWSILRNGTTLRLPVLKLLLGKLPRAQAIPQHDDAGDQKVSNMSFSKKTIIKDSQLAEDTLLVHFALCAALSDPTEMVQRLALELLVFHFPLHEDGVFSVEEKVVVVCRTLLLLATPQNSILRRIFMWFYGCDRVNPDYFHAVSCRYVQEGFIMMLEDVATAQDDKMDTDVFDAIIALQSRPEGEEHFQVLIPALVPSLCKALQAIPAALKSTKLFEVIPWSSFLSYATEMFQQLLGLLQDDSSAIYDNSNAVLKKVSSIVEVSRTHYLTMLTTVPTTMKELSILANLLCDILVVICTHRKQKNLESEDFVSIICLGLDIFHNIYFGIMRGFMSVQLHSGGGGGGGNSEEEGGKNDEVWTTHGFFDKISTLFCTVVESHIITSDTVDSIFSDAAALSTFTAKDSQLFSELCDTLFTMLSHCSLEPEAKSNTVNNGPNWGKKNEDISPPSSPTSIVPNWLYSAQRIVQESSPLFAVAAAKLYFDVIIVPEGNVPLISPELKAEVIRLDCSRKVLKRLWPLFSVSHADYHVSVAKIFLQLQKSIEHSQYLNELLGELHSANCRNFFTFFRVVHEFGLDDSLSWEIGLTTMMKTLASHDNSLNLMGHAFLQQSVPYLHFVLLPLFKHCMLKSRDGNPKPEDMMTFVKYISDTLHSLGHVFVQRTLAIPQPKFLNDLISRFQSNDVPDEVNINAFPMTSLWAVLCYVLVRQLRLEMMHASSPTLSLNRTELLQMLGHHGTMSLKQGDESPLCINILVLLKELLSTSCEFSEPPEVVMEICNYVSIVCVDLLQIAVGSNLPSAQFKLLDLLMLTLFQVDRQQVSKRKIRSESNPNEDDKRESPGETAGVRGRSGERGRLGAQPEGWVVDAIAMQEFFPVCVNGLISGALAELHPQTSCYGLLNTWRISITRMLRLFHCKLSVATSEFIKAYCGIVVSTRNQPLSPATAQIFQRSFQGLQELIQYLFLPSTRAGEGQVTKKDEGGTIFPFQLFGSSATQSTTNYDEAHKELNNALEQVVEACVETYAYFRDLDGSNNAMNRSAEAITRSAVETSVRLLSDMLLKNLEREVFDRVLWFVARQINIQSAGGHPSGSTTLVGHIADLLTASGIVTPHSCISIIDALVGQYRQSKGSKNFRVPSSTLIPYDAAGMLLLCLYFQRSRHADRFTSCIAPVFELMQTHFLSGSFGVPPITMALLMNCLDIFVKRIQSVDEKLDLGKDRRLLSIFCKFLETIGAPSSSELQDEISGTTLMFSSVLVPVTSIGTILIAKEPERVLNSCYAVFNATIIPTAKLVRRIHTNSPGCTNAMQLLVGLLQINDAVGKKLRSDLVDFFFEDGFFLINRSCLQQWQEVFRLLSVERAAHQLILSKFAESNMAMNMVPGLKLVNNLIKSYDEEAVVKGRLLHRLAFYILSSSSVDREFLGAIREKLGDIVRTYPTHGKCVALRYSLLVIRVLMTRVPAKHLQMFWPVVLPEMMRILTLYDGKNFEAGVVMEVLKVIDFSITILPSEFQYFRWVFLDDHGTMNDRQASSSSFGDTVFVPLLLKLQAQKSITNVDLSIVRREWFEKQQQDLNIPRMKHQPLISMPERFYPEVKGVEYFSSALAMSSNCTEDSVFVETPSLLAMGSAPPATARCPVVRRSDDFDEDFVRWLIEGEFVAATHGAGDQSPTSPQLIDTFGFINVQSNAPKSGEYKDPVSLLSKEKKQE